MSASARGASTQPPASTPAPAAASAPRPWRTVRDGLKATPELRRGLAWTLVLAVVAASGRVVLAVGVQIAVDGVLAPGDVVHRTAPAIAVCAAAVVAAALASVWMNRRLVRASENALASLRDQAFSRLLRTPPQRLDGAPRSSLVARVTSDVDAISQFTQSGGISLVTNALQALVAVGVMFWYSWPLAALVLLSSLPALLTMRLLHRALAARFHRVRVAVGHLYGGVGEAIEGLDVIRGFGVHDRIQSRLDALIGDVERAQLRTVLPVGVNTSLGELVNGIVTTAVIVAGVALGAGALPAALPAPGAGELVAFLFLVTFFVRPLQFLVGQLGEAQNAVAGWMRVLEVIVRPDDRPHGDAVIPPGSLRVQARGLSFSYGDGPPAIGDLDVEIAAGSHVVIVGETGSGKSTFAKLLTRQLDAGAGDLLLNGVPIGDVADDALARRVAAVPQDAFLFDRTVAENIAPADERPDRQRVRDVLAGLGLADWVEALPSGVDTRVGQRGEALSAGGRQLVALARAAYLAPDLLVLDEATSGVDPDTDVRVQRALGLLSRGRTTVTIAHRMATARTADRILVFDRGRLVEQGTHAELVAAGGRYAALQALGAAASGGHPAGGHRSCRSIDSHRTSSLDVAASARASWTAASILDRKNDR